MSRDRAEAIWRAAATVNAQPTPPPDDRNTADVLTYLDTLRPIAVVLTTDGWGAA